ncbi:hypothetical protein ElyMa_006877100 [Elysia marginata]|uniref:Uncharacterized protein n=1 Tax=Elysia marginata TaxID=1093978 RepID=A0AAV4J9V9_9GAST|nr:hypothetical protein ElyMa_006877100 [Elysia marginata]
MSWRHRSCQVFTCCGLRLEASTPNRVWSRSSQSNLAKITCTTVKFFHTPTSELVEMTCIQPLAPVYLQAINTPSNIAMTKYFKTVGSKQRGRLKTSIVTTLRRDLKSHNSDHRPTSLHSIKDLDHLHDIAQNRSDWKHLATASYRSAQAETTVDVAADGQVSNSQVEGL